MQCVPEAGVMTAAGGTRETLPPSHLQATSAVAADRGQEGEPGNYYQAPFTL
jgi:hypothetical protein